MKCSMHSFLTNPRDAVRVMVEWVAGSNVSGVERLDIWRRNLLHHWISASGVVGLACVFLTWRYVAADAPFVSFL